ncbi:hypothetical protein N018_07750 [Pseudomonas syringae CC1557]|uniref:Uncharacterized protein n=1 Tax=Pseudomonas syringae CC1557 TaxID=1357279 RepID=W0MYL8_PSESX|nr:hypothetical protein N018_07750 [Pseudomonas syringae CC1557]
MIAVARFPLRGNTANNQLERPRATLVQASHRDRRLFDPLAFIRYVQIEKLYAYGDHTLRNSVPRIMRAYL